MSRFNSTVAHNSTQWTPDTTNYGEYDVSFSLKLSQTVASLGQLRQSLWEPETLNGYAFIICMLELIH